VQAVWTSLWIYIYIYIDVYVLYAYTRTYIHTEEGIIPRSIRQILCTVADMGASGWVYELEGSFLEIYNEGVRDLLTTDKEAEGKQYNIRPGDTGSGCMLVGDLTR
jgi:hypothetical protein